MTFTVPEEVRLEHLAACRELLANARIAKQATLASLFNVLQEGERRFGCGPEAIIHLGINMDDAIPVPVLDLRTPERTGWCGLQAMFLVGPSANRLRGHFIARNLAGQVPVGFEHGEHFANVKRHEVHHVLQAMSGRGRELFTSEDMALCDGYYGILPMLASAGDLSRGYAFELAGRFLLQKFRNELEAYHAVDFPAAAAKAEEGKLNLEEWRKDMLCIMIREFITSICCAFLDVYQFSWRKLVASVRARMTEMVKGSFLEAPVTSRSEELTPVSFLESIRPRSGLLRNVSLDMDSFTELTVLMPRVGQVAVYNPRHGRAVKFLAEHANPAPTLADLGIKGLQEGCLVAEALPCHLDYDITLRWISNGVGAWEYEVVMTAPDGERHKSVYPLSTKEKDEFESLVIHMTTLFQQPGRYGVEIRLEGKSLAKTEYRVVLSRPR
mgnify:CR=1 FL=1